jgi:oxygen-dependent protoporphyrinogen oxidase
MKPVAVIGAGITGLTAAFYLQRKGIPVTVFESSNRVGGVIESLRSDGFLAEFGTQHHPGNFTEDRTVGAGRGFAGAASGPRTRGLSALCGAVSASGGNAGSPLGFFTTELFSFKAKLAVLREPFVPRRRGGDEESVAQFVKRRLGQEFLDHAIDALVAGVYAGDPYKLSVPQAFPKLGQLEERYGSLIKGQILGGRERKKRGEVAKDRAPNFLSTMVSRCCRKPCRSTWVLPCSFRRRLNGSPLVEGDGRLSHSREAPNTGVNTVPSSTQVPHTALPNSKLVPRSNCI